MGKVELYLSDQYRLIESCLLLLLCCLLANCAGLPEHAKPKMHFSETDNNESREGFGYRKLGREDFKAVSLARGYQQHRNRIGARSCISIRPSEESKITIVQSFYMNQSFYLGSIIYLSFEAIFVPSCSWWNPDLAKKRTDYVLQHEQIHFMLTELAARKLTRESDREIQDYIAIGDSYTEVERDIKAKLKELIRGAMERNLKEHTEFDEETSLFYDQKEQLRWLKKVDSWLAESKK